MNYSTVKNLFWTKSKDAINCVVNFEGLGEIPFTAKPDDDYQHCREIYARCVAGEFGEIQDYVPHIDEGPNPQNTGPKPEHLSIPVTDTGEVL